MDDLEDIDWARATKGQGLDPKQRLAELRAKALPRKGKKARAFAKIHLDTAARALAALNCQRAMVWIWLTHRTWKRQSLTVSVPNGDLAKLGVSPDAKRRALQQLEAAGLISIDQRPRKTPLVTLL
jgi:hypothetical protein